MRGPTRSPDGNRNRRVHVPDVLLMLDRGDNLDRIAEVLDVTRNALTRAFLRHATPAQHARYLRAAVELADTKRGLHQPTRRTA